jgi:SAM-dependent methyltransferase
MEEKRYIEWFIELKDELETAYLQHDEPWKQSGFSGPEECWVACRKPIADCVDKSGRFLDIGCANGYLLECISKWVTDRGISIIPYGIDLSEKLIELARKRLPGYSENLQVANGLYWDNPERFDFVGTLLDYIPEELHREYLERIIDRYLADSGKLLVAEYRSMKTPDDTPWCGGRIRGWGFKIIGQTSGYYDGKELTRIIVIQKPV